MWKSHCQKEWEREDIPYQHQVIRKKEAPCCFPILEGMSIPAGDEGSVGNLQIPENNRVANSEDAIPPTCKGDPSKGTCIPLDPGGSSAGTAQGSRSVHHQIAEGY